MHVWKVSVVSGGVTRLIELSFDGQVPLINDPEIAGLASSLDVFSRTVNVSKFDFKWNPAGWFDYEIELLDGRKWTQQIIFEEGQEAKMTFNVVNSWWRLSEFSQQRDIRSKIVSMYETKGLEKIKVRTQ